MIAMRVSLRTVSEANRHEHWRLRQKRAKGQRMVIGLALTACIRASGEKPTPPLVVTLTRVSPRDLDSDNLAGSQKAVRDGVADALGIDDGDPAVTWLYAQRRSAAGSYAVEIEVRRPEECSLVQSDSEPTSCEQRA